MTLADLTQAACALLAFCVLGWRLDSMEWDYRGWYEL